MGPHIHTKWLITCLGGHTHTQGEARLVSSLIPNPTHRAKLLVTTHPLPWLQRATALHGQQQPPWLQPAAGPTAAQTLPRTTPTHLPPHHAAARDYYAASVGSAAMLLFVYSVSCPMGTK